MENFQMKEKVIHDYMYTPCQSAPMDLHSMEAKQENSSDDSQEEVKRDERELYPVPKHPDMYGVTGGNIPVKQEIYGKAAYFHDFYIPGEQSGNSDLVRRDLSHPLNIPVSHPLSHPVLHPVSHPLTHPIFSHPMYGNFEPKFSVPDPKLTQEFKPEMPSDGNYGENGANALRMAAHPYKKMNPPKRETGYTRTCKLSPELAELCGTEYMARYEVVKKVWSIIKEKNLYDPENKQFVICNDELMKVVGTRRFRGFGMMKYLKHHFVNIPAITGGTTNTTPINLHNIL